jgi:hypothetical protein
MKRVLLNVVLSIVVFVFLVSLLVGCSGGNGIVPPPSQEAEKFVGMWINEKPIGPGVNVTKCEIILTGKKLTIDTWVKISGTSENHLGQKIVDSKEAEDGVIEITWFDDLGTTQDELSLVGNKLKIRSTFIPYNPNWNTGTIIDYLIKIG